MSVEKMKMMGVIGKKELMSKILRLLVLNGSIHVVNALVRINSNDFKLPPTEENIEALEELPFLKPFSSKRDFNDDENAVNSLIELFELQPNVKEEHLGQDYDYEEFIQKVFSVYNQINSTLKEIDERVHSIENKKEFIENLSYLSEFDYDIGKLTSMKYLSFWLFKLSKENYKKLKNNYENIPAVIMKIKDEGKHVVAAAVTPKTLKETVVRIFESLNYTLLPIPEGYSGVAKSIIQVLEKRIGEDEKTITQLRASIQHFKEEYSFLVEKGYSRLQMEKRIEDLKTNSAQGKRLFFLFGFVPEVEINNLKNQLKSAFGKDVILVVDDIGSSKSGITPPTRLRNIKLFQPFETLVKMYGTPAYNEKDPTVFFAITYMLLFGAMFGDLGQGLVMFFAGLLLEKTMGNPSFGGILARLGLSSCVFGLFYGSLFGSEEIIPALIIRPMANINTMLIAAICLGVLLLIASIILNILNNRIQCNIEEGYFGKNGWAGLGFYLTFIYAIARIASGAGSLTPALIALMAGFMTLMVLKQPLAHKLQGHEKLYDESPSSYFMEEGFGIVETLLSTMSNTVSFIRVGAFALNHVGLYIAFETVGEMMGSQVGNITMLVIGNIIIIGLEGLVVFIQALRLEYYELFSKFYSGDGIDYNPVKLKA